MKRRVKAGPAMAAAKEVARRAWLALCVFAAVSAGATAAEQAEKAGASPLLALWPSDHGKAAKQEGAKVTVQQVQAALAGGDDVNAKRPDGMTALMGAAWCGNVACVKLLLAAGADVRARSSDGTTPLMEASMAGKADCLKLILARGADVNEKDRQGDTALMWCAAFGDAFGLKLLIEKGAAVNAADDLGETALMWAAHWGKTANVKFLLEKGAQANARDSGGESAADMSETYPDVVALLNAAGSR